ncbi:MAG: hypothetical protein OQJ97_18730 [Rhodospirillales bacterium]|nr:hypothetical protein [Rhodospirillales bacterium]
MELAPFTPWMGKPTPESRRAITRQIMDGTDELTDQIVEGLVQIVAMEGPILSSRAFNLYSKKGGMAKLTGAAVRRFSTALKKANSQGKISMERDPSAEGVVALLWLPTMKRVNPRELGNRSFDDIPASELGEVLFDLAAEEDTFDKPILYQKLSELYGLKQLPKNATARLDFVYGEFLE